MRVVLDTSVFVASFLGGDERRVIELWRKNVVLPCFSTSILEEYFEVLARLGLESDRELAELLEFLRRATELPLAARFPPESVVTGEPARDKLVACALATGAGLIVTTEEPLRALDAVHGIRLRRPAEVIDELGAPENLPEPG